MKIIHGDKGNRKKHNNARRPLFFYRKGEKGGGGSLSLVIKSCVLSPLSKSNSTSEQTNITYSLLAHNEGETRQFLFIRNWFQLNLAGYSF